jgi:hypothetical protein
MELYQSLYENTKNISSDLDPAKQSYIVSIIPKLDQKGHDLLFFLIRMYHNQQERDVTFDLPYQSSIMNESTSKTSIEFNLLKFPPQLQHMINMFVRMHYEYISYENLRK